MAKLLLNQLPIIQYIFLMTMMIRNQNILFTVRLARDSNFKTRFTALYRIYSKLRSRPRHTPGSSETLSQTSPPFRGISPGLLYAIRLSHVPCTCTFWKDAQPQRVVCIYTDFNRFTSRQKAEDSMAMTSGPCNPLLEAPVCVSLHRRFCPAQ